MVQRTPGRQLRKSQIWTLHPLKADVTLPSTTIWMLDAPPWHLNSDFGNFSFFQSFLCVCESFWKILILLKYLLSETVCTFSFISRPHPLPSFPLLRIPWFRLIQSCFSEITGPLFIVLSKLFKKRNLQVHIFFSLFMPFWSIIQWVSILSGLEISPQIPQNVQAQRRGGHVWCLIWCLFRASRKWGTRKESLPSGTLLLKALEKQTSENNDKSPQRCTALQPELTSMAWVWFPPALIHAKGQTPAAVAPRPSLLHCTCKEWHPCPEGGGRAQSPRLSCCHTQHTLPRSVNDP